MAGTENTNHLIIVSGPIGAGKSTLAQQLIVSAPAPAIYIEGDTFWPHIVKGGEEGIHKPLRAVMRAMIAAAVAYAASGYETILDFTIPPWYLEGVHKIAGSREITIDYVVLMPDEAICAERAKTREKGKIEDYSKLHEFYESFAKAPTQIINDMRDAATIATQIRQGLAEGKFRIKN